MNKAVFEGRRKIKSTNSKNVILENYQLTFNVPGIPFWEPSFASILPRKGHILHGVIFEIEDKDFQRIRYSEGGNGVPGIGYQVVELQVTSYEGQKYIAKTLYYNCSAFPNIHEFHPSKRYLNLIIQGAKENKLDRGYIKTLELLDFYEVEHTHASIAKFLFIIPASVVLPFILTYYSLAKYFKIRVSAIVIMAHYIQYILYLFHDYIWIRVFPSGLKIIHRPQ